MLESGAIQSNSGVRSVVPLTERERESVSTDFKGSFTRFVGLACLESPRVGSPGQQFALEATRVFRNSLSLSLSLFFLSVVATWPKTFRRRGDDPISLTNL